MFSALSSISVKILQNFFIFLLKIVDNQKTLCYNILETQELSADAPPLQQQDSRKCCRHTPTYFASEDRGHQTKPQ